MSIHPAETALQKEQRLFRELSARLIDVLLNRMFDLRPEKATRRSSYFFVLFLVSGFVISFFYYPPVEWATKIGAIFIAVLSSTSASGQLNVSINGFFSFLLDVIKNPNILQYLPVFFASFFIALQTAAMYLADVFELEDVSVARNFIRSVALSGSNKTIRIKHGDIAEESRKSPAYLIGGPGKVIVELDSVAVFERSDGTPHIIGPTGKETGGKATLEGFERFRQALDIRDHYVDLRDQDDKSKAVKSRSSDGIAIKATDVRLMFSVFRGDNPEISAEHPYPFNKESVGQIVYKAASRVTPDQINPSTFEFSWINNMVGLIRSRLGGFMSQHNLAEYMASIGMPEVEKVKLREEMIFKQMQQLVPSEQAERKDVKQPPIFQARYKVKNLFAQFADEFTGKARNNGVELHWIGVGTWESPIRIVPEKHLEAWLLTQDNIKNDRPEEMEKIEQAEVVTKMKGLILKVPIDIYYDEILGTTYESSRQRFRRRGDHKYDRSSEKEDFEDEVQYRWHVLQEKMSGGDNDKHKQKDAEQKDAEHKDSEYKSDHKHDLKTLLAGYRNQLIETADLIKNKNEPVPHNIIKAVEHLSGILGYKDWHWVGATRTEKPANGKPPTAGPTPSGQKVGMPPVEESAYQELVQLVGGDQAVADRLIEFERSQFPSESREQLIERAIERLIRDRN